MQIIETTYKWAGTLARRSATRRIILHHAAAVTCTPQQVHQWHLANGWSGIGYHFFVRKDGSVYRGRPEDTVGAHAGNNNYDSIGVCFEGSFDREEMPAAQKQAGMELVAYLKQKYGISTVQRHSDVNATGCPGGHFPFEAIAYGTPVEPEKPEELCVNITLALYMLAKGSKSQQVKLLQRTLIGWGYSVGVYGADGDFGAATEKAVKKFQTANKLAADGIVGKDTWAALLRA